MGLLGILDIKYIISLKFLCILGNGDSFISPNSLDRCGTIWIGCTVN